MWRRRPGSNQHHYTTDGTQRYHLWERWRKGELFRVETVDWTGGQILDDDSAEDMKHIDLTTVMWQNFSPNSHPAISILCQSLNWFALVLLFQICWFLDATPVDLQTVQNIQRVYLCTKWPYDYVLMQNSLKSFTKSIICWNSGRCIIWVDQSEWLIHQDCLQCLETFSWLKFATLVLFRVMSGDLQGYLTERMVVVSWLIIFQLPAKPFGILMESLLHPAIFQVLVLREI